MASDLPEYYFRVRENGAAVFRVDAENRQRRIEMDQIAVVNIRNGEIKPQGDRVLSDGDLERIRQWMTERAQVLAQRDIDDIHRAVDYLNLTTQWVQSKATDDQLDAVTDALLLAMHDLRSTLVRKKADRLPWAKRLPVSRWCYAAAGSVGPSRFSTLPQKRAFSRIAATPRPKTSPSQTPTPSRSKTKPSRYDAGMPTIQ